MTNVFQKNFGQRLKDLRIFANISQEELASKLGVATKTVSYWENGHNAVTFNKIPAIAKVLGVPIYKLFVFEDLNSGNNQEIIDLLNSMNEREKRTIASVIKAILMLK